MAINIFEGARRIALLIAGVSAAITIYAAYIYEPYIHANYSIAYPNGQFSRAEYDCPADAGRHYFTSKTKSGKEVSINLCLLAMSFGKDNDRLIPYKVDEKNLVWGAQSYSSEISQYEKKLEVLFNIPIEDEAELEKENVRAYKKNFKNSLTYLFYGLAIFWAVVWSIGWIVRGFLDIPHGQDSKHNNLNSEAA